MKEKLIFFKKYLNQARHIGAFLPSSRFLAKVVADQLDLKDAKVVVELGAGTGSLTQELTKRIPQNCDFILVERDDEFVRMLKDKFSCSHFWTTEAQDMHHYLEEHGFKEVDCFVSGLPFRSLPKEVGHEILTRVQEYLKPNGVFVAFSYFINTYFFLKKYFPNIKINYVFRNFPPAYVYTCRK